MTGKNTIWLLWLAMAILLQTAQAQPTSKVIDAKQLLLDVKTLSADAMQGRLVGTPGGKKARAYVLDRFKKSGLKSLGASFLQPFELTNSKNEKIQGANVIGYLKGKQNANKYIVVTAHYDHLGVVDGVICPGVVVDICNGADDNASGTAALFALAKYFSQNPPANSIIFVAFDAEEEGLKGSEKFVETPPVGKEAMVVNVNLDMVSRNNANELYAAGTFHYPFLKPYLDEIAKTAAIKLLLGHDRPNTNKKDWTEDSDHFPFCKVGIPFIYFGVEDHPDYHEPTDEFKNIHPTFYVRTVETVLETVRKFDANLAQIETQKAALKKNCNS